MKKATRFFCVRKQPKDTPKITIPDDYECIRIMIVLETFVVVIDIEFLLDLPYFTEIDKGLWLKFVMSD